MFDYLNGIDPVMPIVSSYYSIIYIYIIIYVESINFSINGSIFLNDSSWLTIIAPLNPINNQLTIK